MAPIQFRFQTAKLFPIEGHEQGDTLLDCKQKFSAATGVAVEHMALVIKDGKELDDRQVVSGTMDMIVRPMLIEYSFLTMCTKDYKPAADGYRGTYMTPHMNDYEHTKMPPPTI